MKKKYITPRLGNVVKAHSASLLSGSLRYDVGGGTTNKSSGNLSHESDNDFNDDDY